MIGMGQANRTYRIGEAAEQTGVSAEALRYYERLGLLPNPPRTDGGARRYVGHLVDRVRLINRSRRSGSRSERSSICWVITVEDPRQDAGVSTNPSSATSRMSIVAS